MTEGKCKFADLGGELSVRRSGDSSAGLAALQFRSFVDLQICRLADLQFCSSAVLQFRVLAGFTGS